MLTQLRSAFGITSKDEKEARAIWDDGSMVVDWRTPGLGKQWDPKYFPYWRKWAGEERAIEYSAHYSSIEDKAFWVRAQSKFSNPEQYLHALVGATRAIGIKTMLNAWRATMRLNGLGSGATRWLV